MNKRVSLRIGVLALVALAITACQLATLPSGSAVTGVDDPSLGPVAELPDDQIEDVARGGSFAFETYVSVDLDIDIELVAAAELAGAELAETEIIATVTNPDDEVLMRASAVDGAVNAAVGVATATPYVTLTLSGVGIHERSVVIEDPAEYASISRTMAVSQMSAVASRAQGLLDSDGDGVPDIYDAYPNDPTIAFETTFPGDGAEVFTVAFEDNFPSLGDGDYNDFVVEYSVETLTGRNGELIIVSGSATARAKVAGYDHEFGLMFRIPGFSGTLSTTLNGASEAPIQVGAEVRVPLFPSTAEATVNGSLSEATFILAWDQETSTATLEDLQRAPFDPYLYIKNTDYDVHLIDQPPLPEMVERHSNDEDFRDAAGFPRALLVPSSFDPPAETVSILDAYPEFQGWIDSLGTENADWYFTPIDDLVLGISAN